MNVQRATTTERKEHTLFLQALAAGFFSLGLFLFFLCSRWKHKARLLALLFFFSLFMELFFFTRYNAVSRQPNEDYIDILQYVLKVHTRNIPIYCPVEVLPRHSRTRRQ